MKRSINTIVTILTAALVFSMAGCGNMHLDYFGEEAVEDLCLGDVSCLQADPAPIPPADPVIVPEDTSIKCYKVADEDVIIDNIEDYAIYEDYLEGKDLYVYDKDGVLDDPAELKIDFVELPEEYDHASCFLFSFVDERDDNDASDTTDVPEVGVIIDDGDDEAVNDATDTEKTRYYIDSTTNSYSNGTWGSPNYFYHTANTYSTSDRDSTGYNEKKPDDSYKSPNYTRR